MDDLDALIASVERTLREGRKHAEPEFQSPFRPARLVAVFNRLHCRGCGSIEDQFEGMFEERQHTRTGALHLVRLPALTPSDQSRTRDLPRVRRYFPHDVAYCVDCTAVYSFPEE